MGRPARGAGRRAGVTQLAVTVDTSPDSGVRFRRNLAKRTVKDAPELAAAPWPQIMDLYATGGASSSVILTLTFRYVDVRDGKFLEPEDAARRIGQLVPSLIRRIADAGGGTAHAHHRRDQPHGPRQLRSRHAGHARNRPTASHGSNGRTPGPSPARPAGTTTGTIPA